MRLGTASLATGERVRVFHRSKDESWRTKHALGGCDSLVDRRATRTSRITDHCFARFTIRRACWRPALGSHRRRAGGSPGAESTSGDRVRCADRKMALPPPEIHIIRLPGQICRDVWRQPSSSTARLRRLKLPLAQYPRHMVRTTLSANELDRTN